MLIPNELYNLLQKLNVSLNTVLKFPYISGTEKKLERFLYNLEKIRFEIYEQVRYLNNNMLDNEIHFIDNDYKANLQDGVLSLYIPEKLPNLTKMGLGNIAPLKGIDPVENSTAYFTKLEEVSAGKDTMTGHWEIMGLRIDQPFRVFPDGFPDELIEKIETFSGRKIIGNKPASGTEILDELGQHQIETGDLIVYTSADSVLQIAAHEEVIPLEELYKICEYAREITLEDPYMIGRIIARPYLGEEGNFERTSNRHDYALSPFGNTTLDYLKDESFDVISIGKIEDIFNG